MRRRSQGAGPRQAGTETGQATFEFMLVLPFFFLFLFLAVQGAAVFETWITLEHASREGARCVAVRATSSSVKNRVETASNGTITGGNVSTYVTMNPIDPTTGTPGSDGSVSISSYPYSFGGSALLSFLKLVSGNNSSIATINLTAVTHMRLEEGSAPGTCS